VAKEFRQNLIQRWRDAGEPTPKEMAERTEVAKSVFDIFLADRAMPLPSRREVEAVLDGIGTKAEIRDRWLDRFAQLEQQRAALDHERIAQNRAERGLPPRPAGSLDDLVGAPIPVSGPLAAALEARTVPQLQAALHDLRTAAKLSFESLAKVTDRVPGDYVLSRSTAHRIEKDTRTPTREQVIAFAKACGERQTELRLWGSAADRVIELATTGAEAFPVGQVEVSRGQHPVRYPLGKPAVDETVLSEFRIRVTPKLKFVSSAMTAATVITGMALTTSDSRAKSWIYGLVLGVGGGALALQLRKRIDTIPDETLELMAEVMARVAQSCGQMYSSEA
jgi:transcriptional regulator with XRE-family HTH domain